MPVFLPECADENHQDLRGVLEFAFDLNDRQLPCDAESMGQELSFEVAGVPLAITLPGFMSIGPVERSHFQPDFSASAVKQEWVKGHPLPTSPFGHVTQFSIGEGIESIRSFEVSRLLIRSLEQVTYEVGKQVLQHIGATIKLFLDWLEVLTYRDFSYRRIYTYPLDVIEPVMLTSQGFVNAPFRIATADAVTCILEDYSVPTHGQIVRAMTLAQGAQGIPLSHEFLISALRQFHKQNYRHCVLDAATSVELSLKSLAEPSLIEGGDKRRKWFDKNYAGLVRLFDGLKLLEVSVPASKQSISNAIAQPRNDAIHGGRSVSVDVARMALEQARVFVHDSVPVNEADYS